MFKIHYLTRKQVDVEKYDACIRMAFNTRVYAYSWYLDIVTEDWTVLVLDDYRAVLPIPFLRIKSFLYIKKILQPHFCQQLGVFSIKELKDDEFNSLYNKFISLKPIFYSFNSYNNLDKYLHNNDSLTERINYELDLNRGYDTVYSNYSKNLKRNIKKAIKNNLEIEESISVINLIILKKKSNHKIKNINFRKLKELVKESASRNIGTIYDVKYKGKVIASAFFLKKDRYLTHLVSASSDLGREYGAISFLFDKLIKDNNDIIFDFEGSMIQGISHFFKGFGAKALKYYLYKG